MRRKGTNVGRIGVEPLLEKGEEVGESGERLRTGLLLSGDWPKGVCWEAK